MCTEAYRQALTRDFSSTPSPAPASPVRQAAQAGRKDAGREGVAERPPPGGGLDDLERPEPGTLLLPR